MTSTLLRSHSFNLVLAFCFVLNIVLLSSVVHADLNGSIPIVDYVDPQVLLDHLQNPRYNSQSKQFLSLAIEALEHHPLYTVTSSPYLPPNNNSHYYYSWSPYWWPDANCNLSDPNYMHDCNYTQRDGFFNPDLELATQVRSLANISSDALTLTVAGIYYQDNKMLNRAAVLLRTFYLNPDTLMLPDFSYAQVHRGANSPWPWQGRPEGIIDARAQIYVQLTAKLLLQYSNMSGWWQQDDSALNTWFVSYSKWLETSSQGSAERDASNNHGTWWLVQALTYYLHNNDLKAANISLSNYIHKQYNLQINSSGEQPLEAVRERPFHYRCYNLQALTYIAKLVRHLFLSSDGLGMDMDLFTLENNQGGSIQKAIDYILDHVTPQPGTEDPTEFLPILYTAIEYYGDNDGRYRAGIVKFGGDLNNPPFWTLWQNSTQQLNYPHRINTDYD